MHKSPREAVEFAKAFAPQAAELPASRQTVIFAPAVDLWVLQQSLRDTPVAWGAQNCHWEDRGAFTGETSPAVLAEMLTPYCLVGHSERRALFGETDEMTGQKVRALEKAGITPMLCVGETLQERESGQTDAVVDRQLRAGLAFHDLNREIVIAYEPVWAIGTGRVATATQANETQLAARETLQKIGGPDFATRTSILYGGSVKPDNAHEIGAQANVDGFLVGGASLEVASFLAIARA